MTDPETKACPRLLEIIHDTLSLFLKLRLKAQETAVSRYLRLQFFGCILSALINKKMQLPVNLCLLQTSVLLHFKKLYI
jgi:hypothetical protein